MLRNLLSVGGMTLLSRATGFLRDVMLGAILGAGLLADAFVVAFRLPNHFRAIFGEGAFNAAYVPGYTRVLTQEGGPAAHRFSSEIFTLLLLSQLVLLALAWSFMPTMVDLLAPGFRDNPAKFSAAVTMTRITFPYLLFIALVTLQAGTLNANGRFATAAFAPVLLNVVMIGFLLAARLFPNAGVAASWGVSVSGVLQFLLLAYAGLRAGIMERLVRPRWDANVKRFFTTLTPAVVGAAGVQIALFVDTIIASLLPTGGPSSVYYADRIYQLPLGVIGIAAGTVLLPEMSRHRAAGNHEAAFDAQNRTLAVSLALCAPFFVAFIMIPEIIMRGVFLRGAFTAQAADASAAVLEAYGFGLLAVVAIRSVVASFQADGDTRTPMLAVLAATVVNVALKLVLYTPLGAVGLAAATATAAWINLGVLVAIAIRRGVLQPDWALGKTAAAIAVAAGLLALFALGAAAPLAHLAAHMPRFANETLVVLLGGAGALVYLVVLGAGLRLCGIGRTSLLIQRRRA
jgi:putative peptidoglycan lipid II flippase